VGVAAAGGATVRGTSAPTAIPTAGGASSTAALANTMAATYGFPASAPGLPGSTASAAGGGLEDSIVYDEMPTLAELASSGRSSTLKINLRSEATLSPLANFLIDRACASPVVANYFYWYLKVETEDEQCGAMFQTVFDHFVLRLSSSGTETKKLFQRLLALDNYIEQISACQRDAREQGRRKEGKEQCLRQLLEERKLSTLPDDKVEWIPMPLDPSIRLMGLIPNTASMFASAVYPCVIEFKDYDDYTNPANAAQVAAGGNAVPPGGRKLLTHKIMFKSGDDLRQDQLIMQMISLMDRLLKKVNLDLKLLTYGILAVGPKDGTFAV
jgi:phosphatidylinositol 3-kinase